VTRDSDGGATTRQLARQNALDYSLDKGICPPVGGNDREPKNGEQIAVRGAGAGHHGFRPASLRGVPLGAFKRDCRGILREQAKGVNHG
jgi:hypothetical protein